MPQVVIYYPEVSMLPPRHRERIGKRKNGVPAPVRDQRRKLLTLKVSKPRRNVQNTARLRILGVALACCVQGSRSYPAARLNVPRPMAHSSPLKPDKFPETRTCDGAPAILGGEGFTDHFVPRLNERDGWHPTPHLAPGRFCELDAAISGYSDPSVSNGMAPSTRV